MAKTSTVKRAAAGSATLLKFRPTKLVYGFSSQDEAFPAIPLPLEPCGERLLVQLRTPKSKTAGGIILSDDTREAELWNEQTAKVVAIGPCAFRNRETLKPWKEGMWCKVGDFVRIPKYGADRIKVPVGNGAEDIALFVTIKDTEVLAKVIVDPLSIQSFV